jgi:predicted AAA+ superfamily ATPase
LDEVHRLIEDTEKIFILTGSSARKLKHGGGNLLAGRAFVYHLYALSCFELKEQFDLDDDKTIKEYFVILEDTMIEFFLEPFHHSFRKRLVEKPKFYFFDPRVVRSLSRRLSVPLTPKTAAYGEAFEHFILLEFLRLGSYFQPDYRFSFIRTAGDVEVDLVVERPGKQLLCIEIKSSDTINESDISSFKKITKDIENCEAVVLSQDRFMKKFDT